MTWLFDIEVILTIGLGHTLGRSHINAAFVTQFLNIHINTHSWENPYQCSNSDKAFSHRGHLNCHIMMLVEIVPMHPYDMAF